MRKTRPGNFKVVQSPRMSVNKLGEYLCASVRRRRTIIRDQKYRKPFGGVARYSDARAAIVRQISASPGNYDTLNGTAKKLSQPHPFLAKWQNEHRVSCFKAITSFMRSYPVDGLDFGLADPVMVAGAHNASVAIKISGVSVSLRPDVYIRGLLGSKDVVGLLKLHFSKDNPLSVEAGKYVATLLHLYAEESLASEKVVASRSQCIVLDVRHGALHTAPDCFKVRRQEIEAACEEISQRWNSI